MTFRFVDSFLFKNMKLVYLISENVQITVNINDKYQDKQLKKHISDHLIQLIILSHRCTVKTLREKVFIIEI